jgi:N-acetyltransferase 10
MKKKVDSRIRILAERSVALHERSMYVIVGDNGRDQVVNLHYMLNKLTTKKASVLWCYKNELGFSSNKTKRGKEVKQAVHAGRFDPNTDDPFELFMGSTDIRFCYYRETDRILGKTFGMCVLQDFEALTPNVLCRTIETVEGGGSIVILLKTMASLKQLYTVVMDAHKKFRSEGSSEDIEPRFNERFILSLGACRSCLVMDDEMNVLSVSHDTLNAIKPLDSTVGHVHKDDEELTRIKKDTADTLPIGKIVALTKTADQAKAIVAFGEVISEKMLKHTISLTAGRGRGKSAALGLAISTSVAYGYSNITVTAPSADNVSTLFEFTLTGLKALGYAEHSDYSVVTGQGDSHGSQGPIIRVNVFRAHRQTIQYVEPSVVASNPGMAELLIVDEAAAIPLPVVKKLLDGPHLTLLSSTIQGYEGTGRALALKLIAEMRKKRDKPLRELTLSVPIRYSSGDGIEKWLSNLLCLDSTEAMSLQGKLALPADCQLYLINRDTLFSYHNASEEFLRKLVSLFVSSHYKNTPNDLLLMSDAPKHHVLALMPKVTADSQTLPDVYVAIQVAVEGQISREAEELTKHRGVVKPSGDMIPWTLSQQFHDTGFGQLNGVRVVRIATHPALDKKGYGSEAVKQLCDWLEGKNTDKASSHADVCDRVTNEEIDGSLQTESVQPRKQIRPLLTSVSETPSLYKDQGIDYVGTSFGLTLNLFNFWNKNKFSPMYVRQSANETTGEYSCIMLRPTQGSAWAQELLSDFTGRFLRLLGGPFASMPTSLALSMLRASSGDTPLTLPAVDNQSILNHITRHDIHRLQLYSQNVVDHFVIADLIPILADLFILRRLPSDLSLSPLQSAILAGAGCQRKTVDQLAAEFDLPVSQLLAMFNKAVHKLSTAMQKMLIEQKETSLGVKAVKKVTTGQSVGTAGVQKQSLSQAQEDAAKKIRDELTEQRRKLIEEQKGSLAKMYTIGNALSDDVIKSADPDQVLQIRKEKKRSAQVLEGKSDKPKKFKH